MHDLPLITTLAAGFAGAWLLGLLAHRVGLSPIVGYILAGVLIGPHTPGFVGDVHLAQQLAEVGVILLMFGVGLHFHPKDLLAVKGVAIPGAIGQSLAATLAAAVVFYALGLPLSGGVVLGLAMAVASTVVLMRVLLDAGVLDSPQGHVAVGWLIVEDVLTVVLLVLIPILGTDAAATNPAPAGGGIAAALALALLKLAVFVAIVMFVGAKAVPWVMIKVARLRSRELFTLTVLVLSVAVAAGAYMLFGASMALGAFLAGMMVAQSPLSHQAAADALPLRDAFAVLFFVSVGMLFEPAFLAQEPLMILAGLGVVLLIKPLVALLIVAVLGRSVRTGLTVALGLAQIGEFSFIVSELARRHGLMPDEGHNVLVATAIISIALNPLLFRALDPIENALRRRPRLWRLLNGRAERLAAPASPPAEAGDAAPLVVVVGYGPVGAAVERTLRESGRSTLVIDLNADTVVELQREGRAALFGDAANAAVLEQAQLHRATHMIVTLPDEAQRAAVVAAARQQSPGLRILVRARYLREQAALAQSGATAAIFEEAEAAVALSRLAMSDAGSDKGDIGRRTQSLRRQLGRGIVF